MTFYRSRLRTQSWDGETIGIMVLENYYPYIPGNVANATSHPFPVRYAVIEGVSGDTLLYKADASTLAPFIAAAKKLEAEGVRAITGACGFMALFQKEIAASVKIPVFASSLLQLNFMYQITGKRVGVISADSTCLKPAHFEGTGVSPATPLAIKGMQHSEAFMRAIFGEVGELDDDAIRKDVIEVARELVAENPDIGSILLECSDLPPYAFDVQSVTGLPVFDFNTMIKYVHDTLSRRPYTG